LAVVVNVDRKGCTRSSLATKPLPKEINESFIQNMKLVISGRFSRHGFILFFLHGFIWGLPQFSQYTFNLSIRNNHLLHVSVGLDNTKFFKFLALVLLEIYDVILHLVYDPIEKAYPAFHNTFEPFPLVFV
jgi:hypothetical protein